jgi:digeranylgeranylglycerophospholipid reductase
MKGPKGSSVKMIDVLVIGAGPAGSRAAEVAAEGGASVILVERRKKVGVPVQCAEFLHKKVVHKLEVPSRAIAQDVDGMVTHLFGGIKATSRAPGCVLHRDLFDAFLSERAVKAGAELMLGTLAVEPIMGDKRGDGPVGAVLEHGRTGKLEKVWAKVMIGADGPGSVVGSWIGLFTSRLSGRLRMALSKGEVRERRCRR